MEDELISDMYMYIMCFLRLLFFFDIKFIVDVFC